MHNAYACKTHDYRFFSHTAVAKSLHSETLGIIELSTYSLSLPDVDTIA